MVAILDFVFAEDKDDANKYKYVVKLSDTETNKIFYNKLTFVYLEMPKFKKELSQIDTHFEKWLYVLRHLNRLEKIPATLTEKIFTQLFEVAEIAKFNREQLMQYENSLKYYRDLKSSFDTARQDGEAKGWAEGKAEGLREQNINLARKMKANGYSLAEIVALTDLDQQTVENLL